MLTFEHNDYDPDDDGVAYVAISGRSLTALGRSLALGTRQPDTYPDYGTFASFSGYVRALSGDDRGLIHHQAGVDYDEAITDNVSSYTANLLEDQYVRHLLSKRPSVVAELQELVQSDKPLVVFAHLPDIVLSLTPPDWFRSALDRLVRSTPKVASTEASTLIQTDARVIEKRFGTLETYRRIFNSRRFQTLTAEERQQRVQEAVQAARDSGTYIPAPPSRDTV